MTQTKPKSQGSKADQGQQQTDRVGEAQRELADRVDAAQEAEPTAQVDLGAYSYTMHKPTVRGQDGVTHTCPHRWGHTAEKDAWACARHVAGEFGLEVRQPN